MENNKKLIEKKKKKKKKLLSARALILMILTCPFQSLFNLSLQTTSNMSIPKWVIQGGDKNKHWWMIIMLLTCPFQSLLNVGLLTSMGLDRIKFDQVKYELKIYWTKWDLLFSWPSLRRIGLIQNDPYFFQK